MQNLLVFLHLGHIVIVSLWVSSQLVADAVQMHQYRLKSSNQLLIHLLLPRHKPGTFLGCRRIRSNGQTMVQAAVTEQLLVASIGRERLIVELLPVDKLCLVDEDMVE